MSILPHPLGAVPGGAARATPAPALHVVVPPARPHVTRERLGRALAALAVAAFALVGPAAPLDAGASLGALAAHLVVVLAQGVVIGALLGISHRYLRTAWRAAVAGAGASAALTWWHVGGAGQTVAVLAASAAAACLCTAALGARIAHGASTSAPVTRVLAADYPLVGLVGLATPALWLLSATATSATGAGAAACVALFGASVLASVRASRGPAARGGNVGTVALVAAWAGAGMAPLAAREPASTLLLLAIVTTAGGATAPWLGPTVRERRFEQRALVRASPALATAFLLAVVAPEPLRGLDFFDAFFGAPAIDVAFGAYAGLALVAGYAAAELRGRRQERPARAWRRMVPDLVLLVAGAEALRAVLGTGVPSAWRALAALAAARLGAALYHAYREHVQALRRAGRDWHAVGGVPR